MRLLMFIVFFVVGYLVVDHLLEPTQPFGEPVVGWGRAVIECTRETP